MSHILDEVEGTLKMPGLDHEFKQTLDRVTTMLAKGDDLDALGTLDDLLAQDDEDQIFHAMLIHQARTDFTRIFACLDRLEELAKTSDKRQWLSEQRELIEEAQAVPGPGVTISLAPKNTGIDDLLAPIIARRISQGPDGVEPGPGTLDELSLTALRDGYEGGTVPWEALEAELRRHLEHHRHDRTAAHAAAILGEIHEARGEIAEAKRRYRQVIAGEDFGAQFYPVAANALANLIVAQENTSDQERAESERLWRLALEMGNTEVAAMAATNLGMALNIWQRPDEAVAILQLAIDSGHADEAPAAQFHLAAVHHVRGDQQAARAALEAVVASGHPEFAPRAADFVRHLINDPEASASAAYHQGLDLARGGDEDAALAMFESVIDSGSRIYGPKALVVAANMYLRRNEHQKAGVLLDQAILSGDSAAALQAQALQRLYRSDIAEDRSKPPKPTRWWRKRSP